jgi:hypothetical protein
MSWEYFFHSYHWRHLWRRHFVMMRFICSIRWRYIPSPTTFCGWGVEFSLGVMLRPSRRRIDSVSRRRRTLFSKFPDPLWGPLRRCSGVLGTVSQEVRLLGLGALLPLSNVPSWHTRGLRVYSDTSANEYNSFRNSHSLAEIFVSRNVISRRFL